MLKYMKHIIWICLVLLLDLIWRVVGNQCDGMMLQHLFHPYGYHVMCVYMFQQCKSLTVLILLEA